MPLTVAIQMDHIKTIDVNGDSTFQLALEAQKRGYDLLHYHPNDLSYQDGAVTAWAEPMTVRRKRGDHFDLGEKTKVDLTGTDVILMRQDPPFHMGYVTATHLLEMIHPDTLVVNDPAEVRNAPEKLYVTKFKEFMPPTLVTNAAQDIKAFRDEHQDIILKPLYGNGGAGVFRLRPDDQNFHSLIEMFKLSFPEPIMAQAYLPDVRAGDKRVILVDGEAAGAVNRVPADGEARSNMHVGGRAERAGLTRREREICEALGPDLKARGLIFVGIDVIGDYITEINVTSPTGIQEINRFDGSSLDADIWDAIEARL